jgi:hypothetical protein
MFSDKNYVWTGTLLQHKFQISNIYTTNNETICSCLHTLAVTQLLFGTVLVLLPFTLM